MKIVLKLRERQCKNSVNKECVKTKRLYFSFIRRSLIGECFVYCPNENGQKSNAIDRGFFRFFVKSMNASQVSNQI